MKTQKESKTAEVPRFECANGENDAALLEALRSDSAEEVETAFETLVGRWRKPLLNFFYRLLWDRAAAEDLTQEVFLKVYRRRKEYKPQAKFSTYLYRIGRNCWVDYMRRTKRERKHLSLDTEWEGNGDEGNEGGKTLRERLASPRSEPRLEAQKEERSEALVEAVGALSEEHREVFILSAVQGLSYDETAKTVGVPVGTVKSRMHHAVKRLRERLKEFEQHKQ